VKIRTILNLTLGSKHFSPDLTKFENTERRELIKSELTNNLLNITLAPLEFNVVIKNKKDCFLPKNVSKGCILIYLDLYLRNVLSSGVSNRNSIIRKIKSITLDCSPFTIIRTDISSFYETIDRDSLFRKIIKSTILPKRELSLLKQFFDELTRHEIKGLPRGIALSSTLSEFHLKEFDASLKKIDTLYYSARYVDDIILIGYSSKMNEKGLDEVKKSLPEELILNPEKTKKRVIPKASESKEGELELTFLGYKFKISNKKHHAQRSVHIFMSANKINDYKRKIATAFKVFTISNSTSAYEELEARVEFLTGNIYLPKDKNNLLLKTGIYYNYPEITKNKDNGLNTLDKFLKMNIYSKGCRISKASHKLSLQQKRKLSKYSFEKGHEMKFLKKIKIEDLIKITKIF
jgi:hypothetical protein